MQNTRATEKPYIISGFDDVLRQAENTGLIKSAIKIFEVDATFSGMSELYVSLSMNQLNPKFTLVSGISTWFDGRIENFLTKSKFPTRQMYLRNWLTEWSIENFKIDKMQKILIDHPDQKFIVIFDNSQASLILAKQIQKKFSGKILAIYLHQVIEKDIPAGAVKYYSAFDIALNEYKNQRMSIEEVNSVAKAITNEKHTDMLFPNYAVCPVNYDPCAVADDKIKSICTDVRIHIQTLCSK